MTKIKTSELAGPALDWAVAKCVNPTYGMVRTHQDSKDFWHVTLHGEVGNYAPSTDWSRGGPIIEREGISVAEKQGKWVASVPLSELRIAHIKAIGPTPLIAAMRCHVASKLGDEVDVPEELG